METEPGNLKPGTRNPEPETSNPLSESLAWLDYCLGEAEAAMAAVKLEVRRRDACATGTIDYHAVCEMAAEITILRGRIGQEGAAMMRGRCGGPEPRRRRLRVYCALCGAYLYQLVTDCERVAGVCRTCVYREGGGK